MNKSNQIKAKIEFLKLQKQILLARYERYKLREQFIKRNRRKILALSMDGWPRTKEMKDYPKWLDLMYDAKIKGVYSIGTSNCDVIAQLNRYAKTNK